MSACMTGDIIREALEKLGGAVTIVYPMNLPPYDSIRMEFEGQEDLTGTQVHMFVFLIIGPSHEAYSSLFVCHFVCRQNSVLAKTKLDTCRSYYFRKCFVKNAVVKISEYMELALALALKRNFFFTNYAFASKF